MRRGFALALSIACCPAVAHGQSSFEPPEDDDLFVVEATPESADPDLFRSYAALAETGQRERWATVAAAGIVGLGALAVGFAVHEDSKWRTPFFVAGGVVLALGGFLAIWPYQPELTAARFAVARPTHTEAEASQLRRIWADQAAGARRLRVIGGAFLGVSGIAVVTVGAVTAATADDDPDTSREQRNAGALVLGVGAGVIAGGVTMLLVRSRIESDYSEYVARRAESDFGKLRRGLSIAALPVPLGAGVGVTGAF